MTLPSSGPISIAAAAAEYGLGYPVALSSFYGRSGLPSSGPFGFSGFYGKSNIHVVSISPSPSYGTSANTITYSPVTTASASAGAGPFTFSWSYVSGDANVILTTPASQQTVQWGQSVNSGSTISAVWRCTVTDAGNGNATASADVLVQLNRA